MSRFDNFNRADSNTSINSPSDGGSDWVVISGTWGISSNQGYDVTQSFQEFVALDAGSPNATVIDTITATTATNFGLIGRVTGGSNFYWSRVRPNVPELIVYSVVAGVATAIYDNADAWSDGTMTFDLQGTAIKVYFGASLKANLTDSSLVTGDSHGLYGRYDPSALHNDFTITTASAAIVGTLGLWDPDLDNKSWFDVTFG